MNRPARAPAKSTDLLIRCRRPSAVSQSAPRHGRVTCKAASSWAWAITASSRAAEFRGGMDDEDSVLIGAGSPRDALVAGTRSLESVRVALIRSGLKESNQSRIDQ